jgi:hypothetical protein
MNFFANVNACATTILGACYKFFFFLQILDVAFVCSNCKNRFMLFCAQRNEMLQRFWGVATNVALLLQMFLRVAKKVGLTCCKSILSFCRGFATRINGFFYNQLGFVANILMFFC